MREIHPHIADRLYNSEFFEPMAQRLLAHRLAPTGKKVAIAGSGPTGLTAAPATPTQVYLTWTDNNPLGPTDESGFRIDVSTNGGSTWTNGFATAPADSSSWFMVNGLTAGTSYTFRIEATATNSISAASNNAAATTLSNVTGLNVYEGFSYPPSGGANELSGQSGGFGFTGAAMRLAIRPGHRSADLRSDCRTAQHQHRGCSKPCPTAPVAPPDSQ